MAATPTQLVPRTEVLPGVWLDALRAVYFEALRLLVVADLHWGDAESPRCRGNLVPRWAGEAIEQHMLNFVHDL